MKRSHFSSSCGVDSPRPVVSLTHLRQMVGQTVGVSDWVRVDQSLINDFADVTGDLAAIHVDPERAARTQFKGTIAHGLLTLSLLPLLMKNSTPVIRGFRVGVNVGFDRIRFIAPVPVDSRVRACFVLTDVVEKKERYFQFAYEVTVEIENVGKPAMVAQWLLGRWIDDLDLEQK